MDANKCFSRYTLKNAGRKQKFVYAKNVQFGRESREKRGHPNSPKTKRKPQNLSIYRSALQHISLTLHRKYPVKSLPDQCALVSEEV